MILHITISNFRSIKTTEVSCTFAEKKAPNRYKELPFHPFLSDGSVRVVPCLALYGANASGKTNIIKALETLQHIVKEGITPGAYTPNLLQTGAQVTTFGISFNSAGKQYTYSLAYDSTHITKEMLHCDGELLFSIKEGAVDVSAIVSAEFPAEKLRRIFRSECLDTNNYCVTSFLSVLARYYASLHRQMTAAYLYLTDTIRIHQGTALCIEEAVADLADTKDTAAKERALQRIVVMLQQLDIGVSRMVWEPAEVLERAKNVPEIAKYYLSHSPEVSTEDYLRLYQLNDTDEVTVPFHDESAGTKQLIALLAILLHALDKGHVVVIDELEGSLHPLVVAELIRLFKDKRYNINGAQLIFTTHCTDVMDHELMRISEIGIVNKTKKSGSTVVRIADFAGVRNVTRFRKQYLSGRFAGIPFPYI